VLNRRIPNSLRFGDRAGSVDELLGRAVGRSAKESTTVRYIGNCIGLGTPPGYASRRNSSRPLRTTACRRPVTRLGRRLASWFPSFLREGSVVAVFISVR